VGIDGSRAAVDAALWGAKVAITHGACLRLVHVVGPADGYTPSVDKALLAVAETACKTRGSRSNQHAGQ
jgi:hypothetical protein